MLTVLNLNSLNEGEVIAGRFSGEIIYGVVVVDENGKREILSIQEGRYSRDIGEYWILATKRLGFDCVIKSDIDELSATETARLAEAIMAKETPKPSQLWTSGRFAFFCKTGCLYV